MASPAPRTHTFSTTSLCVLQEKMAKFASDRDWNQYHQPRNLLLALVGEVGELCEIFQWCGDVSCEDVLGWDKEKRIHLGEEMADVTLYSILLSTHCELDLPAALKLQATPKVSQESDNGPATSSSSPSHDRDSLLACFNAKRYSPAAAYSLEDVRSSIAKHGTSCNGGKLEDNDTTGDSPRDFVFDVASAAGQLSEIFRAQRSATDGLPAWSNESKDAMCASLVGLVRALVRLAMACHIELTSACLDKYEKNGIKYPVDKCRGKSNKYSDYR